MMYNIYSNQANVIVPYQETPTHNPALTSSLKDLAFLVAARINNVGRCWNAERGEHRNYDCRLTRLPLVLLSASICRLGLDTLLIERFQSGHGLSAQEAKVLCKSARTHHEIKTGQLRLKCFDSCESRRMAMGQRIASSDLIPSNSEMNNLVVTLHRPGSRNLMRLGIYTWLRCLRAKGKAFAKIASESEQSAVAVNGLKTLLALLFGKNSDVKISASWLQRFAKSWDGQDWTQLSLPKGTTLFSGLNLLEIALLMDQIPLANQILDLVGVDCCRVKVDKARNYLSPVNLAAFANHLDLLKKILDLNTQANNSIIELQRRSRFDGPIHVAAAMGNCDMLQELLKLGLDGNARGSNNLRALHLAVRYGQFAATELMLKKGVRQNANESRVHPFEIALNNDNYDLVRLLVNTQRPNKPKVQSVFSDTVNSLHLGRLDLLKELNLIPPKKDNPFNSLPKLSSSNRARVDKVVKRLKAWGYDINQQPAESQSFIENLVMGISDWGVLEWAFSQGANLATYKTLAGALISSPLLIKRGLLNLDYLKKLHQRGLDLNQQDGWGCTPLTAAVLQFLSGYSWPTLDVVKFLYDNTDALDAKDKLGRRYIDYLTKYQRTHVEFSPYSRYYIDAQRQSTLRQALGISMQSQVVPAQNFIITQLPLMLPVPNFWSEDESSTQSSTDNSLLEEDGLTRSNKRQRTN